MAHYDGTIVGTRMNCGMALREHSKRVEVRFSDGAAPASAYYCEDCAPFVQSNGKAKEEARVTLSDIPMMVAQHYAALVPFVDRELVDALTRDYHTHLLSIATVGNLPEEPTEGDDDKWISVHDRTPAVGEKVLTWVLQGTCEVLTYDPSEKGAPSHWYADSYTVGLVTHWQPLPGKPKGLE